MHLEELVIAAVFASAITLVVLTLIVYRATMIRALRGSVEWLRQFRPWQVFAAVFAVILLFTLLDHHAYREGYFFLLLAVGIAVGFTITWVREFLFLMSLRDEDLPGRFDKPIWAAVLVFLAPLGLFLFRSHRLAHWPEPEPKPRMVPDAAHELS